MVIRIAWTIDDGPTAATQTMDRTLGNIPGTWFVLRDKLGTGTTQTQRLQEMAALQRGGQEIAIHGIHPTINHASWFPVQVSSSVPKAFDDMAASMSALRDFTELLRNAGLRVNFVRLPGGLLSEVRAYLIHTGIAADQASAIARRIIIGEDVTGAHPNAADVQRDYQTLQQTLTSLQLVLWGGSASGPMIVANSWEAESSFAGSGLTDDVTQRFRSMVDAYNPARPAAEGSNRPRSLIVLTHDTDARFAQEVQADVQDMESYAATKGVKIEYYTMTGLFTRLRGRAPGTP